MNESAPEQDPIADEEAEAAAAEAAKIGGPPPTTRASTPPAAAVEGGEGEAEGFELAEEELIDHAEHGDQKHFPDSDARRRRSRARPPTANPTRRSPTTSRRAACRAV